MSVLIPAGYLRLSDAFEEIAARNPDVVALGPPPLPDDPGPFERFSLALGTIHGSIFSLLRQALLQRQLNAWVQEKHRLGRVPSEIWSDAQSELAFVKGGRLDVGPEGIRGRVCLLDEGDWRRWLSAERGIAGEGGKPSNQAEWWNLIQARAWVYLRDDEVVQRFGEPPGQYWTEARLPGGEIRQVSNQAPPHSGVSITMWGAGRDLPFSTLADADGALLRELIAGKVAALGLRNGKGDLEAVSPLSWLDLEFRDDPPIAAPGDHFRPGATRWTELRFRRADLVETWPAIGAAAPHRLEATEWLRRLRLELHVIVNLSLGKAATENLSDESALARLRMLKDCIEAGEIPRADGKPASANVNLMTPVALDVLERAAARLDLRWLIDFCAEWRATDPKQPKRSTPRIDAEMIRRRLERKRAEFGYPTAAARDEASGRAAPTAPGSGYSIADRNVYPDIRRLIDEGKARSAYDAAKILVEQNRVAGHGAPQNRAKRLSTRFLAETENKSKKLKPSEKP